MTGLHGSEITTWIKQAEADAIPQLVSFATGLRRDLDAVTNALSTPY